MQSMTLNNKKELIQNLKDLDTRDIVEIMFSEPYEALRKYYFVNGIESCMAMCDIVDNIENPYLKGTIHKIEYNIKGALIKLQTFNVADEKYDPVSYDRIIQLKECLDTIYVPNTMVDSLKDIIPGNGVKITVDINLDFMSIKRYFAKEITLLDEMPFPWYVCPECGNLEYTASKSEKCMFCDLSDKNIKMQKFTNTKEMYDLINSIDRYPSIK